MRGARLVAFCTPASIRIGNEFVSDDVKKEMEERTNWGDLLKPEATQEEPLKNPDALLQKPDW